MPSDSLLKDLAKTFEFHGVHERFGLPASLIARLVMAWLGMLSTMRQALFPVMVAEGTQPNAEAGAVGEPESVGAQSSLSSDVSCPDGPQP